MEGHLGAIINDDLVREVALLAWLNKSEAGEDMFRLITGTTLSKVWWQSLYSLSKYSLLIAFSIFSALQVRE